MNHSHTKSILVIATYFGQWPIWFPAFLLSCAENRTIDWLFITDCEIPLVRHKNIRFESMTLAQLNRLASQKLGFTVEKEAFSQIDLRPAYGVVFSDYLDNYDFWGHCDVDVIWGDIRKFANDDILDNYDIVSFRKAFLAGHLTLWRNSPNTNRLFLAVSAYPDILVDRGYFNFDEDIISMHIKADDSQSENNLRVYWPETSIAWFRSGCTPDGWYWNRGRIFDPQDIERVYLHYQHWKRHVKHIDFEIGDAPDRFLFTDNGIWSRKSQHRVGTSWKALQRQLKQTPGAIVEEWKSGAKVAKRLGTVQNMDWARRLAANSIPMSDVRYDRQTNTLSLTRLGVRISQEQGFVLDSYYQAVQLALHAGATFETVSDGELVILIDGLRFRVESAADLTTLKQLFVDRIYNILQSSPVVILDVAMHAGFSSLYLANKPNTLLVSCEPCRAPYERAIRNFSANPVVSDRISPVNVGVGPFACSTIAGYLPERDGIATGSCDNLLGPSFEYEEIEVADIVEMIDSVCDTHPDRALVLKIATDNPDYYVNGFNESSLLRRVVTQGRLHKVHSLLINWHTRGKPDEMPWLTSHLTGAGFTLYHSSPYYANGGILFATRGAQP